MCVSVCVVDIDSSRGAEVGSMRVWIERRKGRGKEEDD